MLTTYSISILRTELQDMRLLISLQLQESKQTSSFESIQTEIVIICRTSLVQNAL